MSWWGTDFCPALYSSVKIREREVVEFFNNVRNIRSCGLT
jgi:hypothetical protein